MTPKKVGVERGRDSTPEVNPLKQSESKIALNSANV